MLNRRYHAQFSLSPQISDGMYTATVTHTRIKKRIQVFVRRERNTFAWQIFFCAKLINRLRILISCKKHFMLTSRIPDTGAIWQIARTHGGRLEAPEFAGQECIVHQILHTRFTRKRRAKNRPMIWVEVLMPKIFSAELLNKKQIPWSSCWTSPIRPQRQSFRRCVARECPRVEQKRASDPRQFAEPAKFYKIAKS